MNSMEVFTNLIIKTVLYIYHWHESIERRRNRQELRNWNDKLFWKVEKARKRRLNRRELRIKNENFFLRANWNLEIFFTGIHSIKSNLKPIIPKNNRNQVKKHGQFLAYLFAQNRNDRKEIIKKYIRGIKDVRFKRRSLIENNEWINWDDEESQELTGENIHCLRELFEGYPPSEPYVILTARIQRFHKRFEFDHMWGPLSRRENVLNLRELFAEHEPLLSSDEA